MTPTELQGIIAELEAQRNEALHKLARASGMIAVLKERIKELENWSKTADDNISTES